ncbi:Proteophosphoglycan ppg4 [Favolaschia claudopus]|uniref:Proteophosphoglycan ppg4 n=1 Tax=Favolaschia claudopus TaxID=2862362 RepID=A0AAW0BD90_9AGAR
MSAQIRCDVCLEAYSLDLFRFLPSCGHGLCLVCTEKTSSKRNCVICRHPKGSQELVQIYLTFAEATDKSQALIGDLESISPNSVPLSVQKAGQKLRDALQDSDRVDEDDVTRHLLLDAAKNLEERIYPLFIELDLANDRIAAMTAQIEELRRQLKVAESKEDEIKHLRRMLTNTQTAYTKASALERETHEALAVEKERTARLDRTVQRQISELSAREDESDALRAKVARRDKRLSLLEKKLKLLTRTPKPNDPDDSLQIDNSAENIRVARKSNDWLSKSERAGVRKPPRPHKVLKPLQPEVLSDIEL